MSISISYEEKDVNNNIKRIFITDTMATICHNLKIRQFENKTICKRILEELYVPNKEKLYNIYLHSPRLSPNLNKRLEIIDEYESYVFDVEYSPQLIKDFCIQIEEAIKHGEWESHEGNRRRQRMIDNSWFKIFRKKKN